MEKIMVTRSSMPNYEEYCEEIKDLWDTHHLTNNGAKHIQLENEIKKFLECDNVSLFTNGHLALENIIAAYNFPKGSEIITTPFTFVSTANAIVRNGLIPVFCDIKKDDFTIDVSLIEDLITDKTVAILPVHVYGNICDYNSIASIAKKYNLKVIYDAAHAFGEKVDGINCSLLGDASMYSFHATKVFNTIEGGMLSYSDITLYDKLNSIKNFGLLGEDVIFFGGNAKMNEFQAAMGICNLRHLKQEILKRKNVYERYIENLKDIDGIILNYVKDNVESNYAYFPVIFDGYKYTRDQIVDILSKNNIYARKYFYPAINEMSAYLNMCNNLTPIAHDVSQKVLTLPLYSDLSISDVDKICKLIKER